MRRETMVPKVSFECDGCQYLMNDPDKVPAITLRVPWNGHHVAEDSGPDHLAFHFHVSTTPGDRQDCFRYWAHNPHTMERSLKQRGLTNDQIGEFMSVMLYRQDPLGPGLKKKDAA